jgi:hypothetical protein
MYTLKLKNGDLDLSDRRGVAITGKAKLVQQLSLWITEHYGIDRFHEGYGCKLQDMVGGPHTDLFLRTVENEIRKTIETYMQIQAQGFEKDPRLYSRNEIVYQILAVNASFIDASSIQVSIYVRTLAGTDVTVSTEVDA